MNVLSIGNSFSCDAQRYLHGIAAADGYALNCFNLYIGGCPLATHFRNLHTDQPAYTLEMNGVNTGFRVSIKEALLNREWDVVTLQQASHDSCNYETYQPYLSVLADAVRTYADFAKKCADPAVHDVFMDIVREERSHLVELRGKLAAI